MRQLLNCCVDFETIGIDAENYVRPNVSWYNFDRAHNDLNAIEEQVGQKIIFIGGIDPAKWVNGAFDLRWSQRTSFTDKGASLKFSMKEYYNFSAIRNVSALVGHRCVLHMDQSSISIYYADRSECEIVRSLMAHQSMREGWRGSYDIADFFEKWSDGGG